MSFAAFLKAAALVAQLLPVITAFVQQIETTLVNATGSQKLAAVTAAINTYLEKANADAQTLVAVQSQLGPIVSSLVSAFNLAGHFTSSKAETPAASPVSG